MFNIANTIKSVAKNITRLIFGHEFTTWHHDKDGAVKVFNSKTIQEAMQWVSCALNDSTVKVVDRSGQVVAMRDAVMVGERFVVSKKKIKALVF